jgi:hypothetical protein
VTNNQSAPDVLLELPSLQFANAPAISPDFGNAGVLEWIDVALLRIDPLYQRDIRGDGLRNCKRIVEEFRWSRFSPLVVGRRPKGLFAVIDGQHHAAAAKYSGVPLLPCYVIDADAEEEAICFATINGNITQISGLQIYHAKLAGGDKAARALRRVLNDACVTIPRYATTITKIGETHAIGTLQSCMRIHGAEILTEALVLVTGTGGGQSWPAARGRHLRTLRGSEAAPAVAPARPENARRRERGVGREDLRGRSAQGEPGWRQHPPASDRCGAAADRKGTRLAA